MFENALEDVTEDSQVIRYQLMQLGRLVIDFNRERELTVLYAAARTVDVQIQLRSDLRRSSAATDQSLADLPVWPTDESTPAMLRSRGLLGAVLARRRAVFVETGGGSGRFWDAMSFYTDVMDVVVGWLYGAVADLHRRLRQHDQSADMVTLLHAYGYLMAATNSIGAEQTLCRAFHSVVCFSRAETLAYANFSFAGETLYRLYRLSLPQSAAFDHDEGRAHHHSNFFPALASCRQEIFDDLDQYGMAIDPSLCDYGRKNETEIREVDRLAVEDATRLRRHIEDVASNHEQSCRRGLLTAGVVLAVTSIYAVVAHIIRCVWIIVERRRRIKPPVSSRPTSKQRRLESDFDVERPTTHDKSMREEYVHQRYDGWIRCNGDVPTTDKTETNTPQASDDRTLVSTRSTSEDVVDSQTKILSVSKCLQNAQISV